MPARSSDPFGFVGEVACGSLRAAGQAGDRGACESATSYRAGPAACCFGMQRSQEGLNKNSSFCRFLHSLLGMDRCTVCASWDRPDQIDRYPLHSSDEDAVRTTEVCAFSLCSSTIQHRSLDTALAILSTWTKHGCQQIYRFCNNVNCNLADVNCNLAVT